MRVLRHGVVDSTNERALASIADGSARHGDVHVAEGQSAGRGRRGNAWASARGEGLYLSLVLLPAAPPRPVALTMGAGLAVLEAVHALGARAARLKWPNDVLADGAKLAGILVEARGLHPAHAVVGIGLNVRQLGFPAELERERAVTSLARLGLACSPENALEDALAALLAPLAERMEAACARPEEVARAYAEALGLVGREVRVRLSSDEVTGRLEELALDGLALDSAQGARSRHLLEHVQALEPL
jgi:BirA family transcriptional regulator, biotin operon repressor / biotin---[acetyl-CoA-carboxylase] ligase